jgi:hypothetical protein
VLFRPAGTPLGVLGATSPWWVFAVSICAMLANTVDTAGALSQVTVAAVIQGAGEADAADNSSNSYCRL